MQDARISDGYGPLTAPGGIVASDLPMPCSSARRGLSMYAILPEAPISLAPNEGLTISVAGGMMFGDGMRLAISWNEE